MTQKSLTKILAGALYAAALVASPAKAAQVNVSNWGLNLSGFGMGTLTDLNSLKFNGGFHTVIAAGLQSSDFVINVDACDGVLCLTDTGMIGNLNFQLTFEGNTTGVVVLNVPPSTNTVHTGGVLKLYFDPNINAVPTPDPQAGAGSGMNDGTLIATFQLREGGTVFSTDILDGSNDALFELVSAMPGVIIDPDGSECGTPGCDLGAWVVSGGGPVLLGITDTNTDADPDNDSGIDTTYSEGPFGGQCGNSPSDHCGTWDGTFVLAYQEIPQDGLACRVTGGGVNTIEVDGELVSLWDGTLTEGDLEILESGVYRYTFGGQVGASTVLPPQPSGEWQHNEHGDYGSFAFHGGTSSAIPGTRIVEVVCTDPENCDPARSAPAKQIDIWGIGTFSNLGKGRNAPTFLGPNVTPEPKGNKTADVTFHWFEINIDDSGEGPNARLDCPADGFGLRGSEDFVDCDCDDFYRITIYDGKTASQLDFLPNGEIDPDSVNKMDVIYQVFGYPKGGNLQIHPPTGNDLN